MVEEVNTDKRIKMQLTKHFIKSEFDSKDNQEMPKKVLSNVKKLAKQLQVLRDYLNRPIRINSGYRSVSHNEAIGGVKNSQHILGKAADIVVKNMESKQVYDAIEKLIKEGKMTQGGLGLYKSFVHYDIRNKLVRWDYR